MKHLHPLTRIALVVAIVGLSGLQSQAAFKPLKTKLFRGGGKPQAISVDVTGVKDLYLHVTYGGDNYRSDQAIWGEPQLTAVDGSTVGLATLAPKRAQVGWGRLLKNENQKGQPLRIGSKTFGKGFWAHGPSLLHFKLDGKYTRFAAHVGIDAGAGRNGSVEFLVTNVPPEMPSEAVYAGKATSRQPALPPPSPAAEAPHVYNAAAGFASSICKAAR